MQTAVYKKLQRQENSFMLFFVVSATAKCVACNRVPPVFRPLYVEAPAARKARETTKSEGKGF